MARWNSSEEFFNSGFGKFLNFLGGGIPGGISGGVTAGQQEGSDGWDVFQSILQGFGNQGALGNALVGPALVGGLGDSTDPNSEGNFLGNFLERMLGGVSDTMTTATGSDPGGSMTTEQMAELFGGGNNGGGGYTGGDPFGLNLGTSGTDGSTMSTGNPGSPELYGSRSGTPDGTQGGGGAGSNSYGYGAGETIGNFTQVPGTSAGEYSTIDPNGYTGGAAAGIGDAYNLFKQMAADAGADLSTATGDYQSFMDALSGKYNAPSITEVNPNAYGTYSNIDTNFTPGSITAGQVGTDFNFNPNWSNVGRVGGPTGRNAGYQRGASDYLSRALGSAGNVGDFDTNSGFNQFMGNQGALYDTMAGPESRLYRDASERASRLSDQAIDQVTAKFSDLGGLYGSGAQQRAGEAAADIYADEMGRMNQQLTELYGGMANNLMGQDYGATQYGASRGLDAARLETEAGLSAAGTSVAQGQQALQLEQMGIDVDRFNTDMAYQQAVKDGEFGQAAAELSLQADQFNVANQIDVDRYNNDMDYRAQVDRAIQARENIGAENADQLAYTNAAVGRDLGAGQQQLDFQRTLDTLMQSGHQDLLGLFSNLYGQGMGGVGDMAGTMANFGAPNYAAPQFYDTSQQSSILGAAGLNTGDSNLIGDIVSLILGSG